MDNLKTFEVGLQEGGEIVVYLVNASSKQDALALAKARDEEAMPVYSLTGTSPFVREK